MSTKETPAPETTTVNPTPAPAAQPAVAKTPLRERKWFRVTKKISIETGKVLGGAALGVGAVIGYQKFSGE